MHQGPHPLRKWRGVSPSEPPVMRLPAARRGPSVLSDVKPQVVECLARAAEARRRAECAVDRAARADALDMELRWLRLAASYEYSDRLDRVVKQAMTGNRAR